MTVPIYGQTVNMQKTIPTEANPQFIDAENGNFTVGNKELVGNEIGDPRWLK